MVADSSHYRFAQEICDEVYVSAQERGTGIAKRTPEYIIGKMQAGKAVIAVSEDGRFAGFSYIESWGGKKYVANSGLIVAHAFRGIGLAKRIKERVFQLSRELFPDAKILCRSRSSPTTPSSGKAARAAATSPYWRRTITECACAPGFSMTRTSIYRYSQ